MAAWDLALWSVGTAGLLGVAGLWSPLEGYHRFQRTQVVPESEAHVELKCESGSCWIRPQGEVRLYIIPEGSTVSARSGDEALTLGEGSQLIATFLDDSSELRLQNSGVIRLKKGENSLSMENSDEEAGGGNSALKAQVASPNALVFVGEIPIKIVSPVEGAPIIAATFPTSVHLAFIVDRYEPEEIRRLSSWKIVKLEGELLKEIGTVTVQHTEPPVGGASFYGDFEIATPGFFALIPIELETRQENAAFRFEVQGTENLENQIQNLLQGVTADVDLQLEIHQ